MTTITTIIMEKSNSKFRYRKRVFIIASVFVIAAFLYFLFAPFLNNERVVSKYINVGICGAINEPAVYNMQEGKILANLILAGNGLNINADIDRLDLDELLVKNKIYHIPYSKEAVSVDKNTVVSIAEKDSMDNNSPISSRENINETTDINILYIGYPALFFVITYKENINKLVLTYIPYSTVFLDDNFRMIDIFFTLGLNSTVDVLQKSLNKKIDYYYMQDKPSFVNMINKMGGLDIVVDEDFADEYSIKTGKQVLDGRMIYEYISFVKGFSRNNALDFNKYQALLNNNRRSRQREVVTAIYNRVGEEFEKDKIAFCKSVFVAGESETNIDILDFTSIMMKILKMNSMSFDAIPGMYKHVGSKLYYIAANDGFEYFVKLKKRRVFNLNKEKVNQIIY